MNLVSLLGQLEIAERHVVEGAEVISHQTWLVQRLGRRGIDTGRASALLTVFEESQRLRLLSRDRVRGELARHQGQVVEKIASARQIAAHAA